MHVTTVRKLRRVSSPTTVALLVVIPAPALALDLTLEAFHEAEYSNNIGRTSTNEDDGWIQQPGFRFSANQDSSTVSAAANYDARRRFQGNGYDDESTVTGSGNIEWRALRDLLTLEASNYRTESTISARGSLAPGNRQEISTTRAGGTLKLPSFSQQHLDLGYHYDFYSTDETASDSTTEIATASYVIPFSETRRVALNANRSDVDFDNDLSSDYVSHEGNFQFVTSGADTELDVALGYTEVDRSDGRDNTSGMTGHLSFDWHVRADATASLTYERAFDSRSPRYAVGIPIPGEEVTDDSSLDEVYVSELASGTWTQVFGRNQLTVGATYQDIDYEDVTSDQESTGLNLSIDRRLTPSVRGSLFTYLDKTEFDVDGREDDDWNSGVRLAWEGFDRLTISMSATYFERSSDLASAEYEEWRGLLAITYRLFGKRVPGGLASSSASGSGYPRR